MMEETGGNILMDGDFRKDFTVTSTDDVKYKLEVKYTIDPIDFGGDIIADNGTPRTLALTQQSGTDKLIRDTIGEEQAAAKSDKGLAVIHAVDGRVGIEKKMNKEDVLSYLPDGGSVNFIFTIKRIYNGSTETYGSPVTITKTKSEIEALTADSDGDVVLGSEWIKNLPLGEYTVIETISDSSFTDFYTAKSAELKPAYNDSTDRKDFPAAFRMEDNPSVQISEITGEGHKITVKVENRAPYEIPSAVGTGTYIFKLVGAFLIILSVLLYFRRCRATKN